MIKGEIEVWGQNLNGRINTTINLFIKNKIRIINLSIYKTIICGVNSFWYIVVGTALGPTPIFIASFNLLIYITSMVMSFSKGRPTGKPKFPLNVIRGATKFNKALTHLWILILMF